MPEIPEVQALVDSLRERTEGATIVGAELATLSALKTFDPPLQALVGATVVGTRRIGKHIVIDTADPDGESLSVVIHLARLGWMSWKDGVAARAKPGRGPLALRLTLDKDGLLGVMDVTEAGTKKSLAVHVVRDVYTVPSIAKLGRDPVQQPFSEAELGTLLEGERKRRLKTVLRDQKVLAGVGNAYSDEILHAARLSPFTPANSLTPAELTSLHQALEGVLREGIERAQGVPWNELKDGKRFAMRVHGRTGEMCDVCGDVIREVSYVDESFQYCPTCQTGGTVLADRRMSKLLK